MSRVINTSDGNWIEQVKEAYDRKQPFGVKDDAHVGITADDLGSKKDFIKWSQVVAGFGIMGIGMWILRIAAVDPEPTSKLTLLIGGGLVTIVGGVQLVSHAFGMKWSVTLSPNGEFTVNPA